MPDRGKAVRTIGSATVASALTAVGGLATGILTARILAPSDRGVLAIVVIVVTLTPLVAGIGTSTAFKHLVTRPGGLSTRSFGVVTLLLVPLQILLSFVCLLFFADALQLKIELAAILMIGGPLAAFSLLAYNATDALNAVGRSALAATTGAIGTIATAAVMVPMFFVGGNLVGVIGAYLFGFVLRTATAVLWLRRAPESEHRARWPDVVELLRVSPRFAGLNLGQSVAFRADQLALGIWGSPSSVGYYAVAVTPATLDRLAVNAIAQVAMREEAVGRISRRRMLGYLGASIGIAGVWAAIMWPLAPVLIPWLFGVEYLPAVEIVHVLLIAEVTIAPFFIAANLAAARGHGVRSSVAGLVGVAVMAVALPPLIGSLGAVGAAWGAVIGNSAMSIVALSFEFHHRFGARAVAPRKEGPR
ncbi:oligosaccharide flippase family protein [Microbacterium sp. PRC9]|uniref:lipopolysaccharide biosynthesis protein n=1 Tax=Microbacterium sp. PRC9 TaxID=2962591 RepID=UPI0028816933|nr:oligosaccharide flippase family protein [Microbacterium sp. PRC9]MDT0141476.1 oligosaccharide flippase family protein [Microbacterium sp. PRC9]